MKESKTGELLHVPLQSHFELQGGSIFQEKKQRQILPVENKSFHHLRIYFCFFIIIFFSSEAEFLLFCCLHRTNIIWIVFAYLQLTIHTKSTLSWREHCSIFLLVLDYTQPIKSSGAWWNKKSKAFSAIQARFWKCDKWFSNNILGVFFTQAVTHAAHDVV